MENILDKYQKEADRFIITFKQLREKKIVLYGIGRFTATLIPRVKNEYKIIGLMDREINNIGKIFFGLPILSLNDAEKQADCIIINTTSTYWQTIYRRIKDSKIPVYFLNGDRAYLSDDGLKRKNLTYWLTSFEEYNKQAHEADVVSFDLFDTLLQRKCYLPTDVYSLAGEIAKAQLGEDVDYPQIRQESRNKLKENYSWKELKDELITLLGEGKADILSKAELDAEIRLCAPRIFMRDFCMKLIQEGKEVYILTDMYLPKTFIMKLLNLIGIKGLPESRIWVSNEIGMEKRDGSMWKAYSHMIAKKKAVHFGDDLCADVEMPRKYGVRSCYVMSGREMFHNSSFSSVEPKITSLYASITVGLIILRLFDSPFALHKTRGNVAFCHCEDIGYVMYAPLLLTFLFWLREETEKNQIKNLYFFARDGYFLIEDYKRLGDIFPCSNLAEAHYLYISRQLAWMVSIKDDKDFEEILQIPYIGTFKAYMKSRWGVVADERTASINEKLIADFKDKDEMSSAVSAYKEVLRDNIRRDRDNYTRYLNSFDFEKPFGVVDMGIYGTIQKYLSRILGKKITSWNIVAQEDAFCDGNRQFSCYRGPDRRGNTTPLAENIIFLETFLTAPYGMIRRVDAKGDKVCDTPSGSQAFFGDKKAMNAEVQNYLEAVSEIFPLIPEVSMSDRDFIAELFMQMYTGGTIFDKEAVRSFIYENPTMHFGENHIFE